MSKLIIYQTSDKKTEIKVSFEKETVWLNVYQMSTLFKKARPTIIEHINNIYQENELEKKSTCRKFRQAQKEGERKITREYDYYNLDVIISVGYRVKSQRGTQFRQWATERLKDYLIQGYALNKKRLAEKEMEIKYLKTGIQILNSTLKEQVRTIEEAKGLSFLLEHFANGLKLLDDYDHEALDWKGNTLNKAKNIKYDDLKKIIKAMKTEFSSTLFGQEKDNSFKSAISQISQSFDKKDLYPSIEEKAATLLYLVVKNHAFVDGNKRIAAACFIYFLELNNINAITLISNDALATLTLFIAASHPENMKITINLVISIINRGLSNEHTTRTTT